MSKQKARVPCWWEAANKGTPVQMHDLMGRTVLVGAWAGSGDPAAPFGTRDEEFDLTDVETGERFTVHAEALLDGWPLFDVRRRDDR